MVNIEMHVTHCTMNKVFTFILKGHISLPMVGSWTIHAS